MEDDAVGRARVLEHRAARRRARRGRGSPAPCRAAWPSRCARGTTPPAPPRPSSPGAEEVEPGLADRAHARVARRARRSRRARRRASPAAGERAAPRSGCSATPATTASCSLRAISTAHRAPAQVAADLHDPRHADGGRRGERGVDVEPVVRPSAMSRWQWLSATGTAQRLGRRRARPVALPVVVACAGRPLAHRRVMTRRGPRCAGTAARPW